MKQFAKKTYQKIELDCRGTALILGERTLIMGILNVTPDSFSDGGRFNVVEAAVQHAQKMVESGADIIDVGGESTRPGSADVSMQEELDRVIPVIKALAKVIGVPISIDTYKAEVAEQAILAGASIINDVWGFQREPEIAKVAAKYNVPSILMHNQVGHEYDMDMVESMKQFFRKSFEIASDAGVSPKNIILDPGIGFGKTPEQNIVLMSRLHELNCLGYPILLGTSRKSMIGKILDLPPEERVDGTVATNVLGIAQGIEILRVHDIKENMRAAKVADAIIRGFESSGGQ